MQFEVLCLAQEKGDICIADFVFDEFVCGKNKAVQVGCSDDCLVEICCETYGSQSFNKVSLGCNEVIAEYIYFLGLFFAFFVGPADEQA